jgi:hypothetical protein
VDVLDLITEQIDHNRRAQNPQASAPSPGAEKVIYRKAGDDWF